MIQFLSGNDAFIWSVESDPRLRSTIVTLTLLDGRPDWDDVAKRIDRLARDVPRFRQRVVASPAPAPPRWQTDTDFDLRFHVRRVAAAAPGSFDSLLEMARIAAMADFDHARPLWEVTLVEGLADGGAALLCRLNHALTDGLGAVGLAATLFDHNRTGPRTPSRGTAPRPTISAVSHHVPVRLGRALSTVPEHVAAAVIHPAKTVGSGLETVASITRLAQPTPGPRSPIMKSRSTVRRLAVHEVPTEDLHRAGSAAGGSLNDAFLSAIAGGMARYHQHHHVTVPALRATMPVSLRTPSDPVAGNRTTLLRLDVPTDISSPIERIRTIQARTRRARNERSLNYSDWVAGALTITPRWYVGSALRNVDFVASNVPAFPSRVRLGGAAVHTQYAFAPTLGASFNITLLSYMDTCALGINVDAVAVPDVDELIDCLKAGFGEVLTLARSNPPGH